MKFSLSWLKEFIDLKPETSVQDVCDMFVQLGHEVEGVEDESALFENVVVGHVLSREQHPDADRLGVCMVDVGSGEPQQIVCGAPNVRGGLTVAVALPGAVLPGDFEIKTSKIRGVASNGMICSERELGLGDEHNGIWEMDTDAKVGRPLALAMGRDDTLLDVDVTPNRGDCLSVYGMARDLAAAEIGSLKPVFASTGGKGKPSIAAAIESANTYAFNGIEITGLTNGESPVWLKQRLEQAGLRPRSLVVDVTNYILVTTGQPLHAYDADKVQGIIRAVDAKGGETYQGIGDIEITLNAGDIAIVDDSGVIGLGGILGGESTAVSDGTKRVYLEGAWFDKSRIAQTGQAHQLITDARFRFERGVDPEMTLPALNWAADLIAELGGGTRTDVDSHGTNSKDLSAFTYNPEDCLRFGGMDVPADDQKAILERLGFTVDGTETFQLTAPSWRTYMETAEDVVEEILRVKGYDSVPELQLAETVTQLPLAESYPTLRASRTVRRALVGQGFIETITYSFIKRAHAEAFTSHADALLDLDNPMDTETMTTMRPSLLPGLLVATAANLARKEAVPCMAELGTVFTAEGEKAHAAGVMVTDQTRHWQGNAVEANVYAAKAAVEAALVSFGIKLDSLQMRTPASAWYHPGRSAQLILGKTVLAEFGELHPKIAKLFDLKQRVVMFSLDCTALSQQKVKQRAFNVSPYPAVERDLAFVLDADVAAGQVRKTIQNAMKPLVQDVQVFDMYVGEGIPEGKKSLAFSILLQSAERTLEEKDITPLMDAAIAAVDKHYNGELRG